MNVGKMNAVIHSLYIIHTANGSLFAVHNYVEKFNFDSLRIAWVCLPHVLFLRLPCANRWCIACAYQMKKNCIQRASRPAFHLLQGQKCHYVQKYVYRFFIW